MNCCKRNSRLHCQPKPFAQTLLACFVKRNLIKKLVLGFLEKSDQLSLSEASRSFKDIGGRDQVGFPALILGDA